MLPAKTEVKQGKSFEIIYMAKVYFKETYTSNAPVICTPRPLWARNTGDIARLKCKDLTYDMSPQCSGCAGVLIVCLNRSLLKELVWKVPLTAHLNIYLYMQI